MFDFNKIEDFEKHIGLSIPNYEWLHKQVIQYAEYFVEPDTKVLDIGCSTGRLLREMPKIEKASYVGIDNSNLIPEEDERITFRKEDLETFNDYGGTSLATSLFTMQFLHKSLREKVLRGVREGLKKNGAFIMCEKTYAANGRLQDITNSLYYQYKLERFTEAEILKKEQELRTSFHLYDMDSLISQMRTIGTVEVFWRSYNFVGLIAIKDK